jgi:AraC-like DNA-binding protein
MAVVCGHRVGCGGGLPFVARFFFGGSSISAFVIANGWRVGRRGGAHVIEQLVSSGKAADAWAADIAAAMDEDLISPLAQHRSLRPLLLHLLNNLSERLSSEQAAKIVSRERKYFSKFFQRETGFNFSWWNREVRIRLAAQLLHQRGRSIDSVALAVGYFDLTTFARAFKRSKGIGPQAYRRSRCTRTSSNATPLDFPRDGVVGPLRDDKRREKDDKRRLFPGG